MNYRLWISIGILTAVPFSTAAGQTQKPAPADTTAPKKAAPKAATPAAKKTFRTPWGDPDLQGVWNDATSTPLQRPNGQTKDVLTDEEASDFQETLAFDLTRDRRDGGNEIDVNRAYNDHWMDSRRLKITQDKRTSLIVDPPDGRIPPRVPLSPERDKIRLERAGANERFNAGLPRTVSDFSLPVRCIIRTDSPPYLPTIYNNDFTIYQSPGYVVIQPEMIHSARIIPLDGRPHPPSAVRQWMGDSRGHWEGDTLVVDTTNYAPQGFQATSSAKLHVVERFTRTGPENLKYEFTINDPDTWTKPWSVMIPLRSSPDKLFEYACHEGNTGLEGILAGARADEAAASK